MAKEKFRDIKFRSDSLEKIEQMVSIIDEYQQQGLRLTARQLYYQHVARGLIPNKDTAYKKLTALLTDARYAGFVDWNAIEDRGREPSTPSEWSDPAALVESALRWYRLPRWGGQDNYVELWVEKQALAGVLEPIAREFHATLMVNKGYSSASAMKESADRIREAQVVDQDKLNELRMVLRGTLEEFGEDSVEYDLAKRRLGEKMLKIIRATTILYLGDHDPSGEDMVRDIDVRLKEFGVYRLKVEKVGLTMAQVKQYNPPPNPAKITDPRAAGYVEKFGNSSWEVDALPPNVLTQIIRRAFTKLVDKKKMDAVKEQEKLDKELLREATKDVMERRT